jgi:hypothetical protein
MTTAYSVKRGRLSQKYEAALFFSPESIDISKFRLVPYHYYFYFVFALRPGGPHHRNAAASGANGYATLSLKAGAPAKAAYAVIDSFFFP